MMKIINRGRNAKRNIYFSLLCQILTIVCGLITPRCMLRAFGSEANGAVTSISTFLGYIILLEGGIGGVARAALYKPLAQEDEKKVSEIMAEMKAFFRRVGCFFALYVLIVACFFHRISHTSVLDWTTSFVLVLIISGSTFAQYFIGVSSSILLVASQRAYVENIINLFGIVINTILIVILTRRGCGLITVKLISSFVFVLRPVALWIYVKRNYNITPVKFKGGALKDKWTGLGQHIAFFLHSYTDVVVLTLFGNLSSVSVYSIYYMVTSSIQGIATSFSTGMEAVFGDMYARKELDTLNQTFNIYDTLISVVSIVLFGTTMVLIIPFVQLYTLEITDTNYIQPLFGALLILACLLHCLRAPYHSMIIAAGHFRQTNLASYGEAIINIVSSIVLVIRYGLIGVAIGTVVATLFRFVYYAVYLSKSIIHRSCLLWLKRELINIVNAVVIYKIGNLITTWMGIVGLIAWVKAGILVVIVSGCITVILNMVFYRKECAALWMKLIKTDNR